MLIIHTNYSNISNIYVYIRTYHARSPRPLSVRSTPDLQA